MAKEGFMQRWQREQQQARQNAGMAELKRLIQAGEFPESPDTISAFIAGFYAAYIFQAEQREVREAGSNSHMLAFGAGLIGLMLIGFYGIIVYLGLPTNDGSWAMPITGALLMILCFISLRRSRVTASAAQAEHNAKWGGA